MDKISVYGGAGFLGTEFCRQYADYVYVQDRDEIVPAYPKILYYISTTHNYHIFTSRLLDIQVNLVLLMNVLDAAREKFGENFEFNFVSSWFVYGDTEYPASETTSCNPAGFYSITKRAAEQLLKSHSETFGNSYRILRMSGVIGIDDKNCSLQKNALQFLIKEMCHNNDISIYSVPSLRDILDVRDAARATYLAISSGELNTIYNVCSGVSYDVKELIYKAHKLSRSTSEITEMAPPKFHTSVQVRDMSLNASKLRSLGFTTRYSMDTTLADLISWYKNE